MRFRQLATFTVANATPAPCVDDVVVSGVPLPRGAAPAGSALALRRANGRVLAGQAEITARWPDGSGKWALVTIPKLRLPAGDKTRVRIGLAAAPEAAIAVRRTGSGLSVRTADLRLSIADGGPLVSAIHSRVDNRWQRRAADLDLAMGVERDGTTREYRASQAPRSIEVESISPLRAVIRVTGTHATEDGRSFGPYTLRLIVIADSRQVRLAHSFVFDGDSEKDFVRSSEVVLRANVGGQQQFRFGGDDGAEVSFARQRAYWTPDFRIAELYQSSPSHWSLGRRVSEDKPEIFCAEGAHADGWMELSGRRGRVAVAVRDGWQNHPKSYWADAATGDMRIGLYPRRAERLDLRRYSELIYAHTYETPCTWKKETLPFELPHPARGIRKTHDLLLLFDDPRPSARALFFNRPPMLTWTPQYLAETRVVEPAATSVDPGWMATIAGYLDFLHAAMLGDGGTGYINYFDLPHGYDVAQQRWFHDFGGFGYINDEAMPVLGLWQTYFLTGDERTLAMARAMTRHNADIDCRHLGDLAGYGSRHNVDHWGCLCYERRVSMPLGKRYAHHLCGDRDVVDLARLTLASFEREAAGPRVVNVSCDIPALVGALLFLGEIGDIDATDWLGGIADAIAAGTDDEGAMAAFMELDNGARSIRPVDGENAVSFMMFSCFGGAQAFAELAETLDHAALRAALVRFARCQLRPQAERKRLEGASVFANRANTFRAIDLLAYAWQASGDPAFLTDAKELLKQPVVAIEAHPRSRYSVPGAATREVPVMRPWPDDPPEAKRARERYYPLFPGESQGQFFNIAVYLHKLQGLMLLATAEPTKPERRSR